MWILPVPSYGRTLPPGLAFAYSSLTEAWERLDGVGVMGLFAPDAQLMDGRGQLLERSDIEKTVFSALDASRSCQISYKVLSWTEKNGIIVVRSHQERNIDYGEKRIVRISEREDSWRKSEEGWRIVYVRFLTQTATIDMKMERAGNPGHD